MTGEDESSQDRADLLGVAASEERRPPAAPWTPPLVDVVDQLEALATLRSLGLLSDDDFERQKRKVLARRPYDAR